MNNSVKDEDVLSRNLFRGMQQVSDRSLSRTSSSSSILQDEKTSHVKDCLRVISLARYAYTLALETKFGAEKLMKTVYESTAKAHKLSEIAKDLKGTAKSETNKITTDLSVLTDLYNSVENPPISLQGYLDVILSPSQEIIYNKMNQDQWKTKSLDSEATVSSEGFDVLSLPHVRRIKSITELHESHANMISVSDKKKKEITVATDRYHSPLLSNEEAKSLKKTPSTKFSQHSSLQLHKYSLQKSGSVKSDSSLSWK